MRTYIAFMIVALFATAAFIAITEGPIRDLAWSEDCATLANGGAVRTQAASHDYIDRCNELARRSTP